MPQFDDRLQNSKLQDLHHKEEEALVRSLAPKHNCQYIDLRDMPIDTDALRLVSEKEARSAAIAVFDEHNKTLSVAVQHPNTPAAQAVLESLETKGYKTVCYMVSQSSLDRAWERYRDITEASAEARGVLDINSDRITAISQSISTHLDISEEILKIRAEDSADRTTKTIEVLLGGALSLDASDVHIEPQPAMTRVRYRLDGVLWDIVDLEKRVYQLVLSRLKLLSGLKLNVHDEAQDGRFTFDAGGKMIEVRSSVIPGAIGESMVMRLLDPSAASFNIEHLGLSKKLHEVIREELARPNGAIVTTGPTGSGKTTALYAFLQQVHKPGIKIITIEDPVEYKLEGIVQTQVGDDYTFASGLRSILRQDPDVIMVGEIRDRDVAETTVHAALTGHLVFSTLHTNSAVGAFPRLIDLGVDSRMVGSAFNLMMAQRLVRRLCEECKKERDATTEEQTIIARIMDQPVAMHRIFEPGGCDACGDSGYKGRIGVFEAIRVDEAVEEAVVRDPRESNILEAAKSQGIPSIQQDGIMKVLAGITSIDELTRVVDLYGSGGAEKPTPDAAETPTPDMSEHVV